jgi:membrane protein DedA with SNARE-associated domain
MIDYVAGIITQVDPLTAYLILFGSAFIENTFPPIPGDTVTVIGAYLISTGKLSFIGVWFSTTFGSVLGFFAMYLAGYYFGRDFISSKKRAKIFPVRRIEKTEAWFSRYGYWVIFANRFLSGTRSVISLFAGIFKLNRYFVLVLALISALIWNGLLMFAGYILGSNWHDIIGTISRYNTIVIVITLFLIGIFVVYKFYFKRVRKKNV